MLPLDIPALIQALAWPVSAFLALMFLRQTIGELVLTLGKRVRKFSFGGASLELSEVAEAKSARTVDTEIRSLDAGLNPQSEPSAISQLLAQVQHGEQRDYILIDLGSLESPRWLTSRLYLVAYLLTLVTRPSIFVFVETAGGIRKRYIGSCSPGELRWALAREYIWLETASASAYEKCGELRFDPVSGNIGDWCITQISQQFLAAIRQQLAVTPKKGDWVELSGGNYEHAKWADGALVKRTLGGNLNTSYVVQTPEVAPADRAKQVLNQRGRYVAIVEPDKSFHSLTDRSELLEKLAIAYANADG
jgi:hypothetical protein